MGILYAIFILVFAFYTFIVPDIDVRVGIISIITITNYVTLLWVVSKRYRLEIDIVYIRPIQLTSLLSVLVQFFRIGILYIDHDNQYLNQSLLDTIGQLLNVSLNVV